MIPLLLLSAALAHADPKADAAFREVRERILRDSHFLKDRQAILNARTTDAMVAALQKVDRWAKIETPAEHLARITPARNNVTVHRLPGDLAIVKLRRFRGDMYQQMTKMLGELERKRPIKGLVIDLRGNGGGSTQEAEDLLGRFVEPGRAMLKTEYGPLGKPTHVELMRAKPVGRNDPKIPLAILVDGKSASASELTSGVLQDLGRARIFGDQTFGKGVGQREHTLADGRIFKQTEWRRGLSKIGFYHGVGITPDEVTAKAHARVADASKRGLLRNRGDLLMRGAIVHLWKELRLTN